MAVSRGCAFLLFVAYDSKHFDAVTRMLDAAYSVRAEVMGCVCRRVASVQVPQGLACAGGLGSQDFTLWRDSKAELVPQLLPCPCPCANPLPLSLHRAVRVSSKLCQDQMRRPRLCGMVATATACVCSPTQR